jgi:adenylate cyclase
MRCLRQWRDDFDQAVAIAHRADPVSRATIITYKYLPAIPCGVLIADDDAVREIDDAVQLAEGTAGDMALGLARFSMGVALMHRDAAADRERGLEVLEQVRDMCRHERFYFVELPVVDVYVARERTKREDRDDAIPILRAAIDELFRNEQLSWCIPATAVLVETLVARRSDGDLEEGRPRSNGWPTRQPTTR